MILDPQLQADSTFVIDLGLCQVRLHHNAAFPWLMLIPRRENCKEIIDLSMADQQQLTQEIDLASRVVQDVFSPTKLNVANLGNIVSQLHVHVIVRHETDPAWPGPVWGHSAPAAYTPEEKAVRIEALQQAFQEIPLQSLPTPLGQMNDAALRGAAIDFDWDTPFQAAEKVREELDEVISELKKESTPLRQLALQEELGDLFFVCVGLARHCHVDPERVVETGLKKFLRQYGRFEAYVKENNVVLSRMSVPEKGALWRQFKERTLIPPSAFPLETERLIVRPLEEGDAEDLTRVSSDPRVSQNLAHVPYPYTLADAQAFLAQVTADRVDKLDTVMAIIRKEDQAFMGVVSIEDGRIGYGLHHAFWGQGYGREAVTALVEFWFRVLQRPELTAAVLVDNVASQRILERIGFIQIGPKECTSLAYEGSKPGFWYKISREDFLKKEAV